MDETQSSTADLMARLTASPCCIPQMPLEEILAAYAKLGFRKFEAFTSWCASRLDIDADPQAYVATARGHGIRYASMHLPTEEVEITVRGGNFMTIQNSSSWRIAEGGKACEWREPPTFVSGGDSGNETGHLAELVDFLAAVREGRSTRSNICESYKSMVLYEAIKQSAETGRAVEVRNEKL